MPPKPQLQESDKARQWDGGDESRIRALIAERDRYRRALEMIVSDSRRPELADAEYLRGIAREALDA